ncbi:Os02g0658150, partial [Oryza sativa Japonica Group]
EHVAVHEPGEAAADQRADPVDPVASEVAGGDGGAEGARWVHGAAAERAGGEDVGADDEADRDGRDGAERSLLRVRRRGVHRVHQRERDDDLHHDALQLADAGDAVRRDGL